MLRNSHTKIYGSVYMLVHAGTL